MAGSAAVESVSYEDLYERWEAGNWRATEIDFSVDRKQWHEDFSQLERDAALWNYTMFFHGEDSVTDNLSPYIDAAPREEQKYFLATQQVDEARHAVFFARFMREVVETGGDDIGGALSATRPSLNWGFRKTFAHLDKVADELRRDRSMPMLARAITMYHLVVEAALAQPGQHFIQDYLEDREVLPGFRQGMDNVSRDEQRHIGFGVKLLSELFAADPECKEASVELLREAIPFTVGVFTPPNWDMRYVEVFGSTMVDVYSNGFQSLESKLRATGYDDDDLQRALAVPLDLEPRVRAERAIRLAQGNIIGEKLGPPSRDPETIALMFETIGLIADGRQTPNGAATIQWDFRDADPWYVRIDNGSSQVGQGLAENADLTLRCKFEDWVDITAGREDPRRAMLTGRLRPRGSLRLMLRMPKIFGR